MVATIYEKILFGIKVSNDNILVLNDKLDKILNALVYEQEPGKDNLSEKDFDSLKTGKGNNC